MRSYAQRLLTAFNFTGEGSAAPLVEPEAGGGVSPERRDPGPLEAQSNRASGLNLVVMAVSVWNTAYLGRVANAARAEGKTVPDELLAHVSPLGWEHIGLTGDYLWRDLGR